MFRWLLLIVFLVLAALMCAAAFVVQQFGWPGLLGVMVAFFLSFEVWFQVPLPKGPLEALFGYA